MILSLTNEPLLIYVVIIPFWWLSFWLFLATKLQKYYLIVCLFFILSCPSCQSCLANRTHCTENHATKVTKTQKTKLPKWNENNIWCSIWKGDFFKIIPSEFAKSLSLQCQYIWKKNLPWNTNCCKPFFRKNWLTFLNFVDKL